jgi:hypothetical protein
MSSGCREARGVAARIRLPAMDGSISGGCSTQQLEGSTCGRLRGLANLLRRHYACLPCHALHPPDTPAPRAPTL